MTIEHKARFKNGQHAKAWGEITATDAFAEAANTAMLIMVTGQNGDTPAANSYRLEGARVFLGILSNLTSERKDSRIDDAQNLRTNV